MTFDDHRCLKRRFGQQVNASDAGGSPETQSNLVLSLQLGEEGQPSNASQTNNRTKYRADTVQFIRPQCKKDILASEITLNLINMSNIKHCKLVVRMLQDYSTYFEPFLLILK